MDRYNASNDDDEIPGDVRSRIKGNSGRKPYDTADLVERIRKVLQRKRRKMRQLASAVRVSVSVLRRLMQQGQLRRHTNQIKPSLSGMNTTELILFVLSFLNAHGNEFDGMFNVVHVDEKWFNEDVDKHVYYLLDGEEPPSVSMGRRCFSLQWHDLGTYDHHKKSVFNGKLGIWPFVEEYTAKRASKNHKKGDVYLKNVESVDRDRYRDYLLEHVIPAIKEKWPASGRRERIWIQQDNARPHLSPC
ncbi:TPA: hypothetical protein N0F65_004325 [Lagenidium giganteum]|uniref:Transposase n=1 Tax=Lagenidium giganteum TaxID=4803 RepID=A0AAV2YL58_9STRA|nr:TPA: hypothetical protein N0F65_004325 [Lagenidium giganteum]